VAGTKKHMTVADIDGRRLAIAHACLASGMGPHLR
jgi:hypothetical protein